MARIFDMKSPLGAQLLFHRATLNEGVSQLFEFDIEAMSRSQEIEAKVLLGKLITIKYTLPDKAGVRHFSGHCTRLEQLGSSAPGYFSYRLKLRPWAWFMSRRAQSRIFQNMSIPDVLKKVLGEEPGSHFEARLSGTYSPWEFCVQYRETTLNFVTRLMEQEGIYYFFEHTDDKHKLILCDNLSAHKAIVGTATIPYFRPGSVKPGERHIEQWSFGQEIQSGVYSIDEYNPLKPSTPLFATRNVTVSDGVDETGFEIYDYPGEYDTEAEGRTYANLRLEEMQARRLIFEGVAEAGHLAVGAKFKLDLHPSKDQNKEYFVLSTRAYFAEGSQMGGETTSASSRISFSAMRASQPFRPPRNTPKPIISGVQTGLVVGPPGEEIFPDDQGRVKVQFFWDRESNSDAKSSCWIRVASPWASGQYGFFALPRIGDEVVVTFLEGDPDRPLITGSVFNAENKPPVTLPDHKTQSVWRSKSSSKGRLDNFNEIRFDDKKGSELFQMQAEKNHNLLVKDDRKEEIRGSTHLLVKKEQFEKIEEKQHLEVKQDQSIKVGGTHSLEVSSDWMVDVGSSMNAKAGSEIHLNSGGSIVIEAASKITLTCGGSFITISAAGIDIKGTMVNINSGGSPGTGSGLRLNIPLCPKDFVTPTVNGKQPTRRGKAPKPSGAASTLIEAGASGSTFCEDCRGC